MDAYTSISVGLEFNGTARARQEGAALERLFPENKKVDEVCLVSVYTHHVKII